MGLRYHEMRLAVGNECDIGLLLDYCHQLGYSTTTRRIFGTVIRGGCLLGLHHIFHGPSLLLVWTESNTHILHLVRGGKRRSSLDTNPLPRA